MNPFEQREQECADFLRQEAAAHVGTYVQAQDRDAAKIGLILAALRRELAAQELSARHLRVPRIGGLK